MRRSESILVAAIAAGAIAVPVVAVAAPSSPLRTSSTSSAAATVSGGSTTGGTTADAGGGPLSSGSTGRTQAEDGATGSSTGTMGYTWRGARTPPPGGSGEAPGRTGDCPYPPNRPVMSFDATPRAVDAGDSTTFRGAVTRNGNCGLGNRRVDTYSSSTPDGPFTFLGSATTDDTGAFSATYTPAASGYYRAVFAGDDSDGAVTSEVIAVTVRGGSGGGAGSTGPRTPPRLSPNASSTPRPGPRLGG